MIHDISYIKPKNIDTWLRPTSPSPTIKVKKGISSYVSYPVNHLSNMYSLLVLFLISARGKRHWKGTTEVWDHTDKHSKSAHHMHTVKGIECHWGRRALTKCRPVKFVAHFHLRILLMNYLVFDQNSEYIHTKQISTTNKHPINMPYSFTVRLEHTQPLKMLSSSRCLVNVNAAVMEYLIQRTQYNSRQRHSSVPSSCAG